MATCPGFALAGLAAIPAARHAGLRLPRDSMQSRHLAGRVAPSIPRPPACAGQRKHTTAATTIAEAGTPAQRRTQPPHASSIELLRQFRSDMAASRTEAAIRVYEGLRDQIRFRDADLNAAGMPLQGELRRFHLKARQAAARMGAEERPAAYRAIVHAICDMRRLGMRIGATETAARIYAHRCLGNYVEAVDVWREGVTKWCADAGSAPGSSPNAGSVKYMFPQAHHDALGAAVALKCAGLVREVYYTAVRAMDISHQMSAGTPSQHLHARRAPLFWSLFPAGSREMHRQAQALDSGSLLAEAPGGSGVGSSGAERAWDPARLGSSFLAHVYEDARRWAGADCRLLSRIVQVLIRALFAEGRREPAVQMYIDLRNVAERERPGSRRAQGPTVTREILCEVVGGLCRHSRPGEAHQLLVGAGRGHRGYHAWNSYFDGLANRIRQRPGGWQPAASPAEGLDRLRQAIGEMEVIDGLAPDAVTRSIWLRACFRAGDWQLGERYFRANIDAVGCDAVCWDTLIRGMLGSGHAAAQRAGWQQIDALARQPTAGSLAVDRRLVETVLRHALQHLTAWYEPAYTPDGEIVDRVFRWVEARLSLERRSTFAVVIAAQIRAGRLRSALELYHSMRSHGLWPQVAINCMVAEALAAGGPAMAAQQAGEALAFVEANVPPQHYGPVFLALLKIAVQHKNYDDVWAIIDRHYPLARPGVPFPDARMYQAALRATCDHGDFAQHRRLLDRLRDHLDLVGDQIPTHSVRMAQVYSYFRRQQQNGAGTRPR
ncbi:hypothetical protein LPJ61_001397 [Coemansia biformis]|uniref:Pentacotripeptide-repeat region of PRORP domain-containing protein n=1 Tax=Coemansia biformis TaxID=1286918 RepID=A0A9W8CXC1_9FUNG|nr:hypothetical protein LPJ61_001397 [Coemansia biformis]